MKGQEGGSGSTFQAQETAEKESVSGKLQLVRGIRRKPSSQKDTAKEREADKGQGLAHAGPCRACY